MNDKQREQFHTAYIDGNKEAIKTILNECLPFSMIKFCSGFNIGSTYPQCESVRNEEIWLSSPRILNDPFDCVVNVDYEGLLHQKTFDAIQSLLGTETAKQMLDSDFSKIFLMNKASEIRAQLHEHDSIITDNVFVACFTEIENLSSSIMWGHYANCHKGFCIQYDFRKMNNAFTDGIIPVLYKDDYSLIYDPSTDEECRAYRLQIAFTKAREWQHENEWRILEVNEKKKKENGYNALFIRPTKIYMGCRISQELAQELQTICKEKRIELLQMKMTPESFNLFYEEI